MSVPMRLQQYLDQEAIDCAVAPHSEALTARELALGSGVPAENVAKVVVARDRDGAFVMAVVPSTRRVDLHALASLSGRYHLDLASETDLSRLFPDCDVGAMPPFGNLYGLPVFADACFGEHAEIAFQPGNHHEVARIRYADFDRTVHPVIGEICAKA